MPIRPSDKRFLLDVARIAITIGFPVALLIVSFGVGAVGHGPRRMLVVHLCAGFVIPWGVLSWALVPHFAIGRPRRSKIAALWITAGQFVHGVVAALLYTSWDLSEAWGLLMSGHPGGTSWFLLAIFVLGHFLIWCLSAIKLQPSGCTCDHCEHRLDAGNQGTCPECGSKQRTA